MSDKVIPIRQGHIIRCRKLVKKFMLAFPLFEEFQIKATELLKEKEIKNV